MNEIEYQGEIKLDAIEKQGKKHLKAIKKQEKRLKKLKIYKKKQLTKKIEKEEKSGKIVLLEDNLNNTLMNFDKNFTDKGQDIL